MPHFDLPDTEGNTVDTEAMEDPVIAVIFTCNHCPYAQAYEERLVAIGKEFGRKGLKMILVCSNDSDEYPEDGMSAMRARAKEKNFPFPYCQDESQEVAIAYGALCTPHCFVFGPDRTLRYKGRVDDNWKEPEAVKEHNLREAIQAILKDEDPEKPEANAIGCSIKWRRGNEPTPVQH
jgi:peroxiredoxin